MKYSTHLPPEELVFKIAEIKDHEELSDIAKRSKRHWGYTKETMHLWDDNLTLTESFMQTHTVIKATLESEIVGFFALEEIKQPLTRVSHFWVDTPYLKHGYGRAIFMYMAQYLNEKGVSKLSMVIDPNGSGFFQKMGGRMLNRIEHKVRNRMLEIYEFDI